NIASGTRDHRVISTMYKNSVSVACSHNLLMVLLTPIQILQSKSSWLNSVIINFIQIYLVGWIVHVVLMRRIAGPVSTRRIDLEDGELMGWKCWSDYIHDLAGGVSTASKTAGHVSWRD